MNRPTMHPASTLPLGLLANSDEYVACGVDLGSDAGRRAYWLELFRDHFPRLMQEAVREAASRHEDELAVRDRCATATGVFLAYLDEVDEDPTRYGRLDILAICERRERVLRRFGFEDAYRLAKAKENDAAMALLPGVLAELDALSPDERAVRLIEGVFAGNIFDLGVKATLDLFDAGEVDFHATRGRLKPRPWLVDDLDRWLIRWRQEPHHRCAVLFVDNAGTDIVLGMIPFVRSLLLRGTAVILAANTTASLNDITHADLTVLVDGVAQWDPVIGQALRQDQLELVPSGNGTPLIDLSACSRQLVDAVGRRGVDLVVLEGMGRALESNFETHFTCDALKIAMIKDEGVASVYGGQVFDLVFRFETVAKRA